MMYLMIKAKSVNLHFVRWRTMATRICDVVYVDKRKAFSGKLTLGLELGQLKGFQAFFY